MKVVSWVNEYLELNTISTLDDKEHHCLFYDFSKTPEESDWHYKKINTFQKFSAPMMELYIGEVKVSLPLHWRILCVDRTDGSLTVAGVEDFLHYHLDAFILNPDFDTTYKNGEIRVCNILPSNITTFAPKIQAKNLLVFPLDITLKTEKKGEQVKYHPCIYITDNLDNMKNLSHISQFFDY